MRSLGIQFPRICSYGEVHVHRLTVGLGKANGSTFVLLHNRIIVQVSFLFRYLNLHFNPFIDAL